MKRHILSFEQLNEAVAATTHFKQRVQSRIYEGFVKSLTPKDGGAPLQVSKEEFSNAARRIKQAFGKAIYTIRGNNKIRHSEMGRFQIAQLPLIYVKFGDTLYKPTFSIRKPKIEGSVYYLVGRNSNFKTVLLMKEAEANKSFLLGKMMNHLKLAGDISDDQDFIELTHMSYETMQERTDFYTARETDNNDIIIDMSLSDEEFKAELGASLGDEEAPRADEPNISFAQIQGQAKDLPIGLLPEKQMQAIKGRTLPIETPDGFKIVDITDSKFKKDPNCAVVYTSHEGKSSMPFVLTKSGNTGIVTKVGSNKLQGQVLKVREKMWIKPAKVTEADLAMGKKLFDLQTLTLDDMQYAYFYGEITEVTHSSRDGIIIRIKPSKMVFYRKGKVIQ